MADSEIAFSDAGNRLAAPAITRLMATALASPEILSLAAGFTDNETLPIELVRETVTELLARSDAAEVLQYGTNQGRPLLRELLARRISAQDRLQDSEALAADQFLITNGSQQALALATQVLCDPGDIVFVENPTYFVYLDVLRGAGVDVRDLPRDAESRLDSAEFGRQLDALGRAGKRVKAIYVLGYYSNPATTTLSEDEKIGLAEELAARGLFVPVIEDAAYRELFFDEPPRERSILALEAFRDFPRLYLGTLTKSFATGLKVGFACCTDDEWRQRMLYLKGQHDFGTSNFTQAILEEILRGGRFETQLEILRKSYRGKMRALHETLCEERLSEIGWKWSVPEGGLYLWLEGPDGLDTGVDSAFCRRCLEKGVIYVPGELCMGEIRKKNFVRLSYGVLSEEQLREAGRRFAAAARGK